MLENDSLFKVDIENYNGPLEVLLRFSKSSKSKFRGYFNNKIS